MVGQKWAIEQLSQLATVHTRFGWQTSNLRKYLRLEKSKIKQNNHPKAMLTMALLLPVFNF